MDKIKYQQLKKKGVFNHYIWRGSKNQNTPDNWLNATPVVIFGYRFGWKVEVVKRGYEKVFFRNDFEDYQHNLPV